jgi:hypothetical protein
MYLHDMELSREKALSFDLGVGAISVSRLPYVKGITAIYVVEIRGSIFVRYVRKFSVYHHVYDSHTGTERD